MENIRERFLKIAIELDERESFPEDAFNFFFRNPKDYDEDDDYLSNMYNRFEEFDDYNYDSSSNFDICDDDIIYDSCSNNNQNESESENED